MQSWDDYLPPGPARPDPEELQRFWDACRSQCPALAHAPRCRVRWIGLDQQSTAQVIALIEAGDKTGTFSLPWLLERTGLALPRAGDPIILIDFNGRPRLLVRLTTVYARLFGEMTAADTAIDGSPVRNLDVWKPLHTAYWGQQLALFGLSVSDEMPVLIEVFELLYPAPGAGVD